MGNSHTLPLILSYSKQKESTLRLQKDFSFILMQQKGGGSSLQQSFQPMKDHYNSANEKPLHFELPNSSNEFFVYISPSELPFPLLKKKSLLSFVLWTGV